MSEERESHNSTQRTGNIKLKNVWRRSFTHLIKRSLYSSFFPRYMIIAFIISYLIFDNFEFIRARETQILFYMIQFFNFETLPTISPPILPQTLFLTFFLTYAFASRINLKMRAKFLAFGIVAFFSFILIQFFTITITGAFLGLNISSDSAGALNIFFTTITGGVLIELSLFSNINIPKAPKIRPIIRRTYYKEYGYLIISVLGAAIILFILVEWILQFRADSDVRIMILFYINIMFFSSFAYYFSYLLYQPKAWIRTRRNQSHRNNRNNSSNNNDTTDTNSISFLVAAYNEEELIEQTINSIDKACGRYGKGNPEIIIVNDGSKDRTAEIVTKTLQRLKYCSGRLYSIPNSGKAVALNYGLTKTSGDIVFRIDADTTVDEDIIELIINHFKDPQVASVSGMFSALNLKGHWPRTVSLFHYLFTYNKRAQALVDSIIVQPGAFSVFRKDALVIVGGWADSQFGEDGDLTSKLSRYGFKEEYEPSSVVHTDIRGNLRGILSQRARWGVAFYFSRGKNLGIIKEFQRPKWIVFFFNLLEHGLSLAGSLAIPLLIAAILTGVIEFSISSIPFIFLAKLALLMVIMYLIQVAFISSNILRFGKPAYYILYFPLMKILMFIFLTYIKPQVTEAVLSWSSKWKGYTTEAYQELRKEVRRAIDPQH
jgi:cellulose synthase/poly-beta-1,6-N-acetylglucosamine synthase-like glycosyltransferase